jgi:hypothetical protein
MKNLTCRYAHHFILPAFLATLNDRVMADSASGVFADRNATLQSLDAQYLNDPSAGAHFAGTRVTSILDAGVSTYYSNGGGRTEYWPTRPGVPNIQVGSGLQTIAEHYGLTGVPTSANGYPVPVTGGGTINVGVGYLADTHATASLASGILQSSAQNILAGPSVATFPVAPYTGFGAYGTAYARSELADYLSVSSSTTLKLSGTWGGSLSAGATGSATVSLGSGVVLANNLVTATAHMQISIWSSPQSVFHGGDEESGSFFTSERFYLGGIELDQTVTYGQPSQNIHQTFDVSVAVPTGNFYFYASQWVATGGQTDPSLGIGGPVFTDSSSAANFDHTLQFNVTSDPASGATLTSESGQFLAAVPEPEAWTGFMGLVLAGWAVCRHLRKQGRRN